MVLGKYREIPDKRKIIEDDLVLPTSLTFTPTHVQAAPAATLSTSTPLRPPVPTTSHGTATGSTPHPHISETNTSASAPHVPTTASTTPQQMRQSQPSPATISSSTTAPQLPTTTQPTRGPLGAQIAPLQTYRGLAGTYQTVLAELRTQETSLDNKITTFQLGLTTES